MRALITGGAGFIGSRLHPVLTERGHEVLIVDDLRIPHPEPEPGERLEVVIASLGSDEAAEAIQRFAPTAVFHLAATHYIPYTEAHPEETFAANVGGAEWVMDICQDLPLASVVACSTAAVYGFSDDPLTEDHPFAPRGVYGETKVELEHMLQRLATARPEVTVGAARLFNVYGSGNLTPHIMPILMEQIRRGDTLQVGNLWPKRDYVHVTDVVNALIELSQGPPGFVAYNVGTGIGTSVEELIGRLAAAAGLEGRFEVDPERERADDGHLVSDPSLIMAETGWRPLVELSDGLNWLAQDLLTPAGKD